MIAITAPLFLIAGDAIARALSQKTRARALAAGILVVWVGTQLIAFFVNARRSAVGDEGDVWFVSAAEWQPPLGWALWLLVVSAGLAMAVVSVWPLVTGRDEQRPA